MIHANATSPTTSASIKRGQPGPSGGPQDVAEARFIGALLIHRADQHHVEIARDVSVTHDRRGAEHARPLRTARAVAQDRQRSTLEEAPDRFERDALERDRSLGWRVAHDAAIRIEQV